MPPHESDRPPDSDPPKRNAALTQRRILDAAEQEFARRGFAGARLREISLGAKVQPALIHHYFSDKRGLYEAVIQRAIEQISTAGWRVLEEGKDLRGYLTGFVSVIGSFYETNQNLLAIMRNESHAGSEVFIEVTRAKTAPILEAVLKMTEALQAQGEIRSDLTPRELLLSALSVILYPIVDAPIIQAVLPDPSPEASALRRDRVVVDVLLRAFSLEPAAPPAKKKRSGDEP